MYYYSKTVINISKENIMSWYKRRPTPKNPPKAPSPWRTSPATEKKLEESKLSGPTKRKD
jgi:hypothetical protein